MYENNVQNLRQRNEQMQVCDKSTIKPCIVNNSRIPGNNM